MPYVPVMFIQKLIFAFLTYNTEAYSESIQASTMELFCENS